MAAWSAYGFILPGLPNFDAKKCQRLERVFHIAHVQDARRIIEDGRLKSRPVYDESILNVTRTHVTWLSPNDWYYGSIYGTVRFAFDWNQIVSNKNIYWVEAVPYKLVAVRFLVTDRDVTSPLIHLYDAAANDGPLRYINSEWFWNSKTCLEIMVESDLSLSNCRSLDFVRHNSQVCRLYKDQCLEKNKQPERSATSIVSYIIGSGKHTVDEALTPNIGLPNGHRNTFNIDWSMNYAWLALTHRNTIGGHIDVGPGARAVVRAALLQLAMGKRNQARRLISLLRSEDVLEQSIVSIVRKHFRLPNFRLY